MPDAALPAWLALAALAVLAVWWLHRGRRPRAFTVAALFLWRGGAHGAAEPRERRVQDPRWRRRAAAAACLCIAAAGPRMPTTAGAVEVWFDNSPSMGAREDGGTRRDQAVAALAEALEEAGAEGVTLRPLGGTAATLDAIDAGALAAALPPAASDRPVMPAPADAAGVWLVTDGADPALAAWLEHAPVQRLIGIGRATENVGVVRLAVRRSLASGGLVGLVAVHNAGLEPARRGLEIAAPDGRVERFALALAPGETSVHTFALGTPGEGTLRASLEGSDPLPEDDALALDTAPLGAVGVRIDDTCGRALRTALAAHPALGPPGAVGAALHVRCGAPGGGGAAWMLEVAGGPARPVRAPLAWEGAPRAPLAAEWLHVRGEPEPGLVPVLSDAESTLIAVDPRVRSRVWTGLDLASPALVQRIEYPALVGALLDLALGEALLERRASIQRPPEAMRIAPAALGAPAAGTGATSRTALRDLTWIAALAACLLLLADALAVARRG